MIPLNKLIFLCQSNALSLAKPKNIHWSEINLDFDPLSYGLYDVIIVILHCVMYNKMIIAPIFDIYISNILFMNPHCPVHCPLLPDDSVTQCPSDSVTAALTLVTSLAASSDIFAEMSQETRYSVIADRN